jgi:hypothetical protein
MNNIPLMMVVLSALVIGVSAAIVTPQYVNAASNDDGPSRHHLNSDSSKTCTRNGTPMIPLVASDFHEATSYGTR